MLDIRQDACQSASIVSDAFPPDGKCAPSRRYPTGPQWHCVRTLYNAEIIADIELRLAGFTVLNPSIWKPATRPRRDSNGVIRPGKPDRIEAMFKRYLFLRFDRALDDWQQVRRLRGVETLFSSSSNIPVAIPDPAIDAIRAVLSPNDCAYPFEHGGRPAPLLAGSRARLLTGPMAELTGICEWSDGRRVKMLMQILGRSVPVTVAQSAVEPI